MKKLMSVSLAVSALMLSGCAMNMPQARWYKDGVSANDTKSFHASCIYKVGMNKVDSIKENTLIESCMLADGFRWGIPPQK